MESSSVQEIIGCIGHPVGGNPTQFVLERAFDAAGLDSRCLTADVPPDRLEAAIQGMRALGFRGAVIASPHGEPALKLMDSVSEFARTANRIDFVHCRDGQLMGEHSGLQALQKLIVDAAVSLEGLECLIYGDGPLALAAAMTVLSRGICKIHLVCDNDRLCAEVQSMAEAASVEFQTSAILDPLMVPAEVAVIINATFTTADPVFDFSNSHQCQLAIDARLEPVESAFAAAAGLTSAKVLSVLDVHIARATVAFQTWTGSQPDRVVIREALEEFLMV